ncbi:MAG: alanine/glycine:cation symporter family protein [Acetanaerobacterium sp.]
MEHFSELVARINDVINSVVWGVPMLVLIIATGIYMTVRTRFFQVTKAKFVNRETIFAIFTKRSVTKTKEKKAITQFQALTTALAATIGTGNIAGVATAITVGGPGAVFWMWVSAFFGMMTNFSENVLGIYYRKKNVKGEWSGGAMYYLENGLKNRKVQGHFAKPLAIIFSIFCVLASFGIGNMTQVNSISLALHNSFHIPTIASGVVLAVLTSLVIIGGIKRIGKVTEKLVPFMAIAYIVGAFVLLIINIQHVPTVFGWIFEGAFGFDAVAGGISGTLIKQAITMGFKRGVFSNEAGLGSSVMVHSASDVREPVIQGMWGIFEVFADTIIVCTLTAFAILSTGAIASGLTGVALVSNAFTHGFGPFAGFFVSIAVLLFAFSTVLGWSFYGTKAMEYLLGAKSTIYYKVFFVLFVVVGSTMDLSLAWNISDTFNGLMALPNLIGVLLLSGTVVGITKNYIDRNIKKKSGIAPMLSAYPEINQEQAEKLAADAAQQG